MKNLLPPQQNPGSAPDGVGVDNYTVVDVHNENSNKFYIQDNRETKNIILTFKCTLQNFTISLVIF